MFWKGPECEVPTNKLIRAGGRLKQIMHFCYSKNTMYFGCVYCESNANLESKQVNAKDKIIEEKYYTSLSRAS